MTNALQHRPRYKVGQSLFRICRLLRVSPERLCAQAGLPIDMFTSDEKGVTIEQYFAIWKAFEAEADAPGLPVVLGQAVVQIGFVPAIFAFACSPTVEVGLARLARFKPMVGPTRLTAFRAFRSWTGLSPTELRGGSSPR